MDNTVDKERFMDDIIDNFYEGYSLLLARQIQDEGFPPNKYDIPENTISICDVAIKCIINTFEQVVTELLTSFDDAKEFIHIYSWFSNPNKKKPIIFRHTCRYILSILPKLQLSTASSEKSDEHNILELCKLIALTKLLHSFIQAKSLQLIENKSCMMIEVNLSINIEYTNENIIALNSSLENTSQLIHKTFASEDDFKTIIASVENNSPTFKTLMDYTSQLIDRRADIFEVTREILACNNDPIISGLTFATENVNLYEAVHSPYNTFYRTRFRPILQLNIDGESRYFTTAWLVIESMDELNTNLIPYGELPKGWEKIHDLKQLCKELTKKSGKSFEDEVFRLISPIYNVKRNISGFHNVSLKKQVVPNTNRTVGEIDFLLIDTIRKVIFVIEAKCTKTKFYFQSFNNDKSTFDNYSIKLKDKVQWVESHKNEVGKFFKVPNLGQYSVNGLFVTNSLIYYNFFSDIPIIPLDKLRLYIETSDRMCVIP